MAPSIKKKCNKLMAPRSTYRYCVVVGNGMASDNFCFYCLGLLYLGVAVYYRVIVMRVPPLLTVTDPLPLIQRQRDRVKKREEMTISIRPYPFRCCSRCRTVLQDPMPIHLSSSLRLDGSIRSCLRPTPSLSHTQHQSIATRTRTIQSMFPLHYLNLPLSFWEFKSSFKFHQLFILDEYKIVQVKSTDTIYLP